ncbi:LacI family DNA-binding transcriptional regulator [Microbacterium sp.]|uniref:LacI family DNA-binding transcriptional regulator n=1 Tax=Microbacterium sp. TaxID=51671 RepID=UPI003A845712
MSSLEEVARRVGVSTATVSRALSGRGRVSEATRARVRAVADDMGYVVSASASSLASGRTRSIGVLVPLMEQWFFATVISGIAHRLSADGYDITLYNVTGDPAQRRRLFDESLRRRRVDGLIALSTELDAADARELRDLELPVVGLGTPRTDVPALRVDDVAVARTATEHLIGLGHRRIAHIGLDRPDLGAFDVPTLRWRGFHEALADAGLRPASLAPADCSLDAGHRAAMHLLGADDPPTAVFATSDEVAFGTLFAARRLGLRVPEDLSLIGVDGHEMAEFFDLSTVAQFPHRQGERAADAILSLVETGTLPTDLTLPHRLIPRGSTVPPR